MKDNKHISQPPSANDYSGPRGRCTNRSREATAPVVPALRQQVVDQGLYPARHAWVLLPINGGLYQVPEPSQLASLQEKEQRL